MFKKLSAFVLAGLMSLTLVACGSTETESDTIKLKVWGSQDDQAMLTVMIDEFKAANPDQTYEIELAVVGEPDAFTTYSEDPDAAADVFAFANDQLKDFVNSGGLYKVTKNKDEIVAANLEGAVAAATLDDVLYAYPMTADNGYFMYYDSRALTEEEVNDMETILDVAANDGKKFFMDISNGWYNASFFIGAGCTLGIDADGVQTSDYNNENGLKAAEAMKYVTAHDGFLTGDDDILKAGFADGSIIAGVSGAWNATDIAGLLGDGYAATKLPVYGDDDTQMGSFAGYKLIGINSQTSQPEAAMALAEWLTNEENQATRFETRGLGPSNINVANSDAVQSDVALGALAQQSEFAISQNDVLANFWTPTEALGTTLEAKDYSKSLQDLLDEMVAQICQ